MKLEQSDQSCIRRHEPACVEVEGSKVILEVHVEPFTTRPPRFSNGGGHDPSADSLAPRVGRHNRVEKERVSSAVPSDVHEANQLTVAPSADPAETVAMNPPVPVLVAFPMAKRFSMQRVDLGVVESSTPLVRDRHNEGV